MKSVLMFAAVCIIALNACGQNDKSKRPSPPAKATSNRATAVFKCQHQRSKIIAAACFREIERNKA